MINHFSILQHGFFISHQLPLNRATFTSAMQNSGCAKFQNGIVTGGVLIKNAMCFTLQIRANLQITCFNYSTNVL